MRYSPGLGRVGPCQEMGDRTGRGSALVEIDAIDDEGPVDGVREGAPHPQR